MYQVVHHYLQTASRTMQSRLRKRGRLGKWSYIHTIRKQVHEQFPYILYIYIQCTVYYFDVYICVQICEKAQFETLLNYQRGLAENVRNEKMFECLYFCNLMMNGLESFLCVYDLTTFLVYNIKALQHQVAKSRKFKINMSYQCLKGGGVMNTMRKQINVFAMYICETSKF